MSQIPKTFEQAVNSGYVVTRDTATGNNRRRVGKLRLEKPSQPELTVAYVANPLGYQFDKPEVVSKARKAGA